MIGELVGCFERTATFMREQVADLSDEEMVLTPPGVPNHAAWTLGHVIHGCQAIAVELGAEPWLPGDWESAFAYGSLPSQEESERSCRSTLLAGLVEAADRLRIALLAVSESDLAKPLPGESAGEILPTLGDALLQVVAAHPAYHAGQLAAWRRAIGRAPVGTFV